MCESLSFLNIHVLSFDALSTPPPITPNTSRTGLTESSTVNVQGEEQKKLDVLSNQVFRNMLVKSGNGM